ncbi:MAG: ChaN family lipoprotein, partial [Rhodospirillaceae bacterium]|nr:ChaN family lipoprotein [Rhodospirillaceae bacterium]
EQFERDVQPVLDQYLAGDIGEATLRDKGRAWDNYPVSYRPLVEYAKANGLAVIAAEAPNMVVRCVGRLGPDFLKSIPTEKQHWSALTLRLDDGPYKDRFIAFAGGNAGHGESTGADDTVSKAVLRSFAGQVTRDETMAESIVQHITANPGRRVVHLNGSFHSAGFLGTAERVQWGRPDLNIAVVHPIEVADPARPEIPDDKRGEGTLLLLIQPEPKSYASDDEERDAIIAQMKFRKSVDCEM